MASYGFVYVLKNSGMPDLYKIGCTERSPHARAEELSSSSGVPQPFEVVCYAEVKDCFGFERCMHDWLKTSRVNPSREFFDANLRFVMSLMKFYAGTLSFTSVLSDFDLQMNHDFDLESLFDPWAPKNPPAVEVDTGSPEAIAADAINTAKSSNGFKDE